MSSFFSPFSHHSFCTSVWSLHSSSLLLTIIQPYILPSLFYFLFFIFHYFSLLRDFLSSHFIWLLLLCLLSPPCLVTSPCYPFHPFSPFPLLLFFFLFFLNFFFFFLSSFCSFFRLFFLSFFRFFFLDAPYRSDYSTTSKEFEQHNTFKFPERNFIAFGDKIPVHWCQVISFCFILFYFIFLSYQFFILHAR